MLDRFICVMSKKVNDRRTDGYNCTKGSLSLVHSQKDFLPKQRYFLIRFSSEAGVLLSMAKKMHAKLTKLILNARGLYSLVILTLPTKAGNVLKNNFSSFKEEISRFVASLARVRYDDIAQGTWCFQRYLRTAIRYQNFEFPVWN